MADFKITDSTSTGVSGTQDGLENISEGAPGASETEAVNDSGGIPADAVTRIAEELSSQEIDGSEALERLLAEVVNSPMMEGASPEMMTDLEESLRSLIETDPYLRSLALDMGIKLD